MANRTKYVSRGFGGLRMSGKLERNANIRAKKTKQVIILNGVNDCLSANFDHEESITAYETLIHTGAHKCSPETIPICTPLPLGDFRNESNVTVNKFNSQLCSLVSKVGDLFHTKVNLIDLKAEFQNYHDYIYTDGLKTLLRQI